VKIGIFLGEFDSWSNVKLAGVKSIFHSSAAIVRDLSALNTDCLKLMIVRIWFSQSLHHTLGESMNEMERDKLQTVGQS
jgi:hypothetical protein